MGPGTFLSWWLIVVLLLTPAVGLGDWEPSQMVGIEYPPVGRAARITGIVVIRLSLRSDGVVVRAEPVSGHPVLADAARKNAMQWKFKLSGQEKAAEAYLVYRFVLEGSCAGNDCRTSFTLDCPNFVTLTSEMPSIQASNGISR